MIQRIQSIYLLIAGLVMLAMYNVPVAVFTSGELSYNLFACHILHPISGEMVINVVPMAVLPLLSLFLSLFALLKFKNRTFQMKLGKLNVLVLLVLIVVQGIYFVRLANMLGQGKPGFSAIVPLIAIILVFMANKAIRKDDNLIRSADRIR